MAEIVEILDNNQYKVKYIKNGNIGIVSTNQINVINCIIASKKKLGHIRYIVYGDGVVGGEYEVDVDNDVVIDNTDGVVIDDDSVNSDIANCDIANCDIANCDIVNSVIC